MSNWNNNWVANPTNGGSSSITLHSAGQNINTISLANIAGAQGSGYNGILSFDEFLKL